jgi:hypothetical protein
MVPKSHRKTTARKPRSEILLRGFCLYEKGKGILAKQDFLLSVMLSTRIFCLMPFASSVPKSNPFFI